jgi:hypothetical protein
VIGRVLAGRYELGEVVGQGGMAVVHRALDRTLGREVALKVLRDQYSADPEFVERFEREARAAARLAHPNIVDIYDVGSDDGTHYIVMELVEGENLKSLVRRGGRLPPALVIRFGREIASALDYAHRRGLVHRDVKPQNVLVDADGHTKLTDFGIAQAAEHVSLTQTGIVLGTAQYMAPEQAQGKPIGPATDLYSLGVVLYELATGRLPFEGDSPLTVALRHVQEQPIPPRRLNPSLPPELETVILRAMAKDPGRRYASGAELAQALASGPDPLRERTAVVPAAAGRPAATRRQGEATTRAAVAPSRVAAPPPRRAMGVSRRPKGGGRAGTVVLLLLTLASLGLLALGFNWLFGSGRLTATAARPTATAVPVVATATRVPPTATRPPPTATPPPATPKPAPTATPVPPTLTAVPTPTAAPTTPPARATVPRLIGMNVEQAQAQLGARNLIMEFRDGSDPRQPDGVIIDQVPREGEAAAPRSVVRVVVNRLHSVNLLAVPNVSGKSEVEARAILEKEGFKVAVEEIRRGNRGIVNDQSPEPGIKVAPGTEVTIVVGR